MNTSKLRGWIAESGWSGRRLAQELEMTEKTFYTKMNGGSFKTEEAALIKKLTGMDSEKAVEIFLDCE